MFRHNKSKTSFVHHIIYFDSNFDKIIAYKKILKNILPEKNISFEHIEFENLISNKKIHIAISPANSYLSMTGGIDKTYANLFPGIENSLRNKMIEKKYSKSTVEYKGTNYILPIGKTLLSETKDKRCYFIMASPTMTMPKDICGSNNVYLSMKAVIKKLILLKQPIIVACPCMGTGIGGMSAIDSALQIKKAINEILN